MMEIVDAQPRLHPAPSFGWLNDPNGLVRYGDSWHVFFQHNPHAPVHDQIHWGHLSSEDLVSWHEHPVAFGPQPGGPDEFGCWSGSFLPWLDAPAVSYSGVVDTTFASTVCVREALDDDLLTWGPPRVVATTPTTDGVVIMRDPFIVEHDDRRFAIVGAGLQGDQPAVLVFDCTDPEHWRYDGIFLSDDDPTVRAMAEADIWECPQLVWIDGEPVVIVSLWVAHRLTEVVAIHGQVTYDGAPRFRPNGVVDLLDLGPVFYAPQAVADGPNPLLFGWIRQTPPVGEARQVTGCLTLPRRLRLRDGHVESFPDPACEALVDRSSARTVSGVARDVSRVRVTGLAGVAELSGTTVRVEVPAGATVWVDGEVVELYPSVGPPTTLRDPATESWRLQVPADAEVTVQELSNPAR